MEFVNAIENTLLNNEFNTSVTENGAVGYHTTGKELVDINFTVSSMRHMTEQEIVDRFVKAFYEDKMLAIKWLFYLRDCREGLGERRSFRAIMKYLTEQHTDIVLAVLKLIPEYGRWDDLIALLECDNTKIRDEILKIIQHQLECDIGNIKNGKSCSLLGKWMPSINCSSVKTKKLAKMIIKAFKWDERKYRKTLSELRKYIDVVERKMSAKEWDEISYSTVPSNANIKYASAFLRNDEYRRREYLDSLKKGETKINASVLFPHDIVHKYSDGWWCMNPYDETLEQMWKSLKNIGDIHNTIVVADGSGSMTCRVDNSSSVTALEIANALAIYCGERCNGEFKNKYITFSERPQLVNFGNANSLHDKLEIARRYNEVADTNIEAVFDLILKTAVNNNMSQNEIPRNILILSDMEFNMATGSYRPNVTLFNKISQKYAEYGYKLPRLIFWNLNSRTNAIPVKENELGVALVSGFSVNVFNMVMNGEIVPYKCLVKILNSKRYSLIEQSLVGVLLTDPHKKANQGSLYF